MVGNIGGMGQQSFDPDSNKETASMENVLKEHGSDLEKVGDPKEWKDLAKEILTNNPSTKGISESKIDEFLTSKSKQLPSLKEEPLKGIMIYPNEKLLSQGVSKGDTVYFKPNSEYEFYIDGVKMYRMFDHQITMKDDSERN